MTCGIRGTGTHDRSLLATLHQLFGPHEFLTQFSTRVKAREMLLTEALRHEKRHRQRVAQGQGRRRTCRRHQIHWARFFRNAAIEGDIGGLGERGTAVARDGDQACAQSLDRLEEPQQFVGLPAVRERNDHVLRLQDAEISVNRLSGMKEERRRAGARKRRGDLAADDARLAHAGHDHATFALHQQTDRVFEGRAKPIDQRQDSRGFRLKHLARERQIDR